MLDALLDQLARQRGIGDAYHTYRGELRVLTPATKTAILAAMGCRVDDADAVRHEIAELDAERWRSLLPVVAVIRPGRTGVVIAVPADLLDQPVEWTLRLAGGQELAGSLRAGDLTEFERAEIDGRWRTRRLLVLPGTCRRAITHCERGHRTAGESCTLIAAPSRCHRPAVLSRSSRLGRGGAALHAALGIELLSAISRISRRWCATAPQRSIHRIESTARALSRESLAFQSLQPVDPPLPERALHIAVEQVPEFADVRGPSHGGRTRVP
jgi:hypothetical protein